MHSAPRTYSLILQEHVLYIHIIIAHMLLEHVGLRNSSFLEYYLRLFILEEHAPRAAAPGAYALAYAPGV